MIIDATKIFIPRNEHGRGRSGIVLYKVKLFSCSLILVFEGIVFNFLGFFFVSSCGECKLRTCQILLWHDEEGGGNLVARC
jgi:hypothetical protein